jgi:DNA-directed RNA polymerase specialized sigma24 family protein
MHPADVDSGPKSLRAAHWHRIVDANAERLWRLALAAGLGPDAAAEVCQLAWLRLRMRLRNGLGPAEIPGWLDQQVRREAVAAARSSRPPSAVPAEAQQA